MTDERAKLVERLRDTGLQSAAQAADQIEADGQRIAELEALVCEASEPSPYCPVCGSCGDEGCCGEKRCLYPDTGLTDRIVELEAMMQKLIGYAGHDEGCQIMTYGVWSDPIPCTCGYSDIARTALGGTP